MDRSTDHVSLTFSAKIEGGINPTRLIYLCDLVKDSSDDKFVVMIDFKTSTWYQLPSDTSFPPAVFGEKLDDIDNQLLFENYRKQRKLMIGNVEGVPALVHEEHFSFIRNQLDRQAKHVRTLVIPLNTTYSPRNVKPETADLSHAMEVDNMYLPLNVERHTMCVSPRVTADIPWCVPHSVESDDQDNIHEIEKKPGTVMEINVSKRVPSRPNHTPTSVEPSVTFIEGLEPIEIAVCPASGIYDVNRTEKYSIQASEMDGAPSFAPNLSRNASPLNQRVTYAFEGRNHGNLFPTRPTRAPLQNPTYQATPRQTPRVPPRHPPYIESTHRLDSFYGKWNPEGKPPVDELVKWGFFCAGRFDLVRCFQCGAGLKDWIEYDDVMIEHIKASPECPYLIEILGEDKVNRLKLAAIYPGVDFSEGLDTDQSEDSSRQEQTGISNVSSLASALPRTSPPASTAHPVKPPPFATRHPRYQTMDDRLASLRTLPPRVIQSHQSIAIAGFFYTGEQDILRCFTCDGGLRNLDPEDEPIREHARYFPTCQYVLGLKGANYVKQVQLETQGAHGGAVTNSQPAYTSQPHDSMNSQMYTALQTTKGDSSETRKRKDCADYLRSASARAALEMGYSKNSVKDAIERLLNKGTEVTSDTIVNLLLDTVEPPSNPSPPSGANGFTKAVEPDSVFTENERLKSLFYCILCLTGQTDILCLPCTHHRICHNCAEVTTHCPVCGRFIQEKIKTYLG